MRILSLIGAVIFGFTFIVLIPVAISAFTSTADTKNFNIGLIAALVSALAICTVCIMSYRRYVKQDQEKAKLDASKSAMDEYALKNNEFNALLNSKHLTTTLVLIASILLVTASLFAMYGKAVFNPSTSDLYKWGGNYGGSTAHKEFWRLFTSMFLHGSGSHLISNLIGLFAIGRVIDFLYGWRWLVIVYILAGLVGSLTSAIGHPDIVSIGASGAIFGLYGAALVGFFVSKKLKLHNLPKSVLVGSGLQALNSLAYGLQHAGIDNHAHIGGLAAGFVFTYLAHFKQEEQDFNFKITFVELAAVALFTLMVFPQLVPVTNENPVSLEQEQNDFVKSIGEIENLEQDLAQKWEADANDKDYIERLKWLEGNFLPDYHKAIESLKKSKNHIDSLDTLKALTIKSAEACATKFDWLISPEAKSKSPEKLFAWTTKFNSLEEECDKALEERIEHIKSFDQNN